MTGRRLTRELRHSINRLAHERAQMVGGSFSYGRRYAEEKARLEAVVLSWLENGDAPAEALAKLEGGREGVRSKRREAIRALQRQIREIP